MPSFQTCPAILIAAPACWHCKTSAFSALAWLHTWNGCKAVGFKCGVDAGEVVRYCGAVHASDFHATAAKGAMA
jgi:hypothetical protein